MREFGINHKAWDWRVVFEKLVIPSLFNQHSNVRIEAIDVTIAMYRIVGSELKEMIKEVDGLNNNLL